MTRQQDLAGQPLKVAPPSSRAVAELDRRRIVEALAAATRPLSRPELRAALHLSTDTPEEERGLQRRLTAALRHLREHKVAFHADGWKLSHVCPWHTFWPSSEGSCFFIRYSDENTRRAAAWPYPCETAATRVAAVLP